MTLSLWQIAVVCVMAYVLWHLFALRRPGSLELKNAKINYINFGLVLTGGLLGFACLTYMYYPQGAAFPRTLLELSYISWTATICAILQRSGLHNSLKIVGLPMLLGTLVIHYLSKPLQTGVLGFLRNVDAFTKFSGGEGGAGLKLSVILKFFFFFLNAFVVLHYYGEIFQIMREDRVRTGESERGLQEEAIKRLILVLSLALSVLVALVLAGIDVKSLSLSRGSLRLAFQSP